MESLRYRTYKLMAEGEWTLLKLAGALGISEQQARNVLKNMKYQGMIERVGMAEHHGVYKRIEGITLSPRRSGTQQIRKAERARGDRPANGFGAGVCELERVWARSS